MLLLNNGQLKQFLHKCQKDKIIGIDTEFHRTNTYYPKLCLIQIAFPEKDKLYTSSNFSTVQFFNK